MNIRNKYWIASLSLLLSLSLVAPFCCDAVAMDSPAHQEMQSHDTQCNCGHELVKDYQKNTKVAASQDFPVFTTMYVPEEAYNTFKRLFSSQFTELPPGLFDDSTPPLHLLNSVFLN